MKKLKTEIIEKGVVIGPAFKLYDDNNLEYIFQGISKEVEIFENAIQKTLKELNNLYEKYKKNDDYTSAELIKVHKIMLEDELFTDSVKTKIAENKYSAVNAVLKTSNELSDIFSNMDNQYMAQRVNDLFEITSQVISNITSRSIKKPDEPSILITENLTCNDILNFENNIIGIAAAKGLPMSHAAILARKKNIPTVYGIENIMELVDNKDTVIINNSQLIINPSEEAIKDYEIKKANLRKEKSELNKITDSKIHTRDGREIEILANISSYRDLNDTIENNMNGIGLFRTEFLFLNKSSPPSEEEQFQEYKKVLERLKNKEVTIRTVDIGSDKQVDYINLSKETNPALGKRGIRILIENQKLFKTQIRALLRAGCYGNLKVMHPMIISVEEVLYIKKQIENAAEELEKNGYDYKIPPIGIMIETPAAALISDELAPLVDFFSIGTNDLTQYTLASDRENPNLHNYMDLKHHAVLKQIEICTKNAHKNGIPCSICGEIASDESMVETFLDMNVDKISINPSNFLNIISAIKRI